RITKSWRLEPRLSGLGLGYESIGQVGGSPHQTICYGALTFFKHQKSNWKFPPASDLDFQRYFGR
ncbi:MAG: hypothetical protein ACI814_004340, partial [Mariniblastus sp.]